MLIKEESVCEFTLDLKYVHGEKYCLKVSFKVCPQTYASHFKPPLLRNIDYSTTIDSNGQCSTMWTTEYSSNTDVHVDFPLITNCKFNSQITRDFVNGLQYLACEFNCSDSSSVSVGYNSDEITIC